MRVFFGILITLCIFSTSFAQAKKTVCLNMIVKDEAAVIKRALDSVKPFIDYWVILDTGSTDGTQELIKEALKDIPGELHEAPWVNFGYNRSQALELAKEKADYILIIDADDYLVYEPGYAFPLLTKDSYQICRGNENVSWLITQLVKSSLPWKWVGALHEYIACDCPASSETLKGISYIQTVEGSRSKDPQKYWKHVSILEEALKKEPNNPRYVFYLAESYRDAGGFSEAIRWYQRRVEMGGWDEEVYWSLLQIAKLKRDLNHDPESVIEAFYRAHRFRPHRNEAPYYLAEIYNKLKKFDLAYACIKGHEFLPRTKKDILFNEDWIEKWGMLFQRSISSYYVGNFQESLDLCDQLLETPGIPLHFRKQIEQNRVFPLQKLGFEDKTVLLAILARNKAHVLPTFLKCIEELDYDKKRITVYINTNNNVDDTQEILDEWVKLNQDKYSKIVFDSYDLPEPSDDNPYLHDWNTVRWNALAAIRNASLQKTKEYGCDYYFTVDCDNFVIPYTLKELISKNKPIIAPLLRAVPEADDVYSNFFADVDQDGYYRHHPDYFKIFKREETGTFKVPVVHQAYLIKAEYIDNLSYLDERSDWEFIAFSRNARKKGIDQYICNEKDFGCFLHFYRNLTLEEERSAFKQIPLRSLQSNIVDQLIKPKDKRYHTFKRALELMEERQVKTVVETGTARGGSQNTEGDGASTLLFADWAKRHDAVVYSVDIDEEAIRQAKSATLAFQNAVRFIHSDSVRFLQEFPEKIDFLYLDSFEFDAANPVPSQRHHLKEIEAVYDKLTPQSVIMIDDCKLPHGGKGKDVIAFLCARGWEIIEDGYQVILTRSGKNGGFITLLNFAKKQEHEKKGERVITENYLNVHHIFPSSLEPLYYLSHYLREEGKYEKAFQIALQGIKRKEASQFQPVEKWIYEFGMLLEFSLCAHSCGKFEEAIEASQKLLKDPDLTFLHPTLRKNISYYQAGVQVSKFAEQKWGEAPPLLSQLHPKLHVCTVATHTCKGLSQLQDSCKVYQIEPVILGLGETFSFGQKLRSVKEYLQKIPDHDIVLFLDAFDTLILADEKTILDTFYSMEAPFVISAEMNCHPFPHFAAHYPNTPTRFKYLNSGSYIGYCGYIKRLLEEVSPIPDETDDQGLLMALYLYHPYLFKLDHGCRLFLTLDRVKEDELIVENQSIYSPELKTKPCVVHGNGGGKNLYQRLYERLFS